MVALADQLLLKLLLLSVCTASEVRVFINGTSPIFVVDGKSPSFALGMGIFEYGWTKYLNNTKLLTLVAALGPSYLRIGGTKSDYSFFKQTSFMIENPAKDRQPMANCIGEMPNKAEFDKHRAEAYRKEQLFFRRKLHNKLRNMETHISYTGGELDDFMKFVTCANWELIFDLNLLDRRGGRWDPTNTLELFDYAKRKRYRINWELGNEPNSYFHKTGIRLSPTEVAKAYLQLHTILKDDSWWASSKLIGPDVNNFRRKTAHRFLNKFLFTAGGEMSAVTFHQYYIDGRTATAANFTDPILLNSLLPMVKAAVEIVKGQNLSAPVWLGETSSAYGGGARGLSDSFIAGFMWLDKLGLCAANGIDVVFRQTLLEGNYAILNDNFDPRPDYWLSVLYKRLVGPRVLGVRTSHAMTGDPRHHQERVRVYAHCTNTARTIYPPGSVTIYYLNMSQKKKTLIFHPSTGRRLNRAMVYSLTSAAGNLTSSDVYLNGRRLQMISVHALPRLLPRIARLGAKKGIPLPKMSFGFIVLPDVNISACSETK